MSYQWMGRYRSLVSALIRYGNVYGRVQGTRFEIAEGLEMTPQEWQILEFIVEHSHESKNMISIAESLAIPQSTFSKTVKMLCSRGLAEKYQSTQNRKNVILKPSELAEQLYEVHAKKMEHGSFGRFFAELEGLSDREIEKVTRAVEYLFETGAVEGNHRERDEVLIKLD